VAKLILDILSLTSSSLKWEFPALMYSLSIVWTANGAPPDVMAWYFNLFMLAAYFGFVETSVNTSFIFWEVKIGSLKVRPASYESSILSLSYRAMAPPALTKHSLFGYWSAKWGNVIAGVSEPMHSMQPPIPPWVKQALTAEWDRASICGSQALTQNFSFSSGSLNGSFNPQTTLQFMSLSPS